MVVCVCNRVSDKDIRNAVLQGIDSMEELGAELRVATCCGRCGDCARKLLNETVAKSCSSNG